MLSTNRERMPSGSTSEASGPIWAVCGAADGAVDAVDAVADAPIVAAISDAQRRADDGRQRNDDVGILQKRLQRFLDPGVALDDVEALMMADPGQRGLLEHEIIQHGDAVARMQEQRHHHRAQVPGPSGDENFVAFSHYSISP